jgi:hypothetical protein
MSRNHKRGQRFDNPATMPKLKATPSSPSSKKACRARRQKQSKWNELQAEADRRARAKRDPGNYGL